MDGTKGVVDAPPLDEALERRWRGLWGVFSSLDDADAVMAWMWVLNDDDDDGVVSVEVEMPTTSEAGGPKLSIGVWCDSQGSFVCAALEVSGW